jgi:hypothetical protein
MRPTDQPASREYVPTTVRIGGMRRSELLGALRERNVLLNDAATALFGDRRFTTLGERRVIELAALSVGDLGFAEGATYAALVARALEAGLVECPLETAPHLRLQLTEQPDASDGLPMTHGRAPPGSITVASTPLDDEDESPKGFYLRHVDGVAWLRGYRSWAGHVWSREDVLVFSRAASTR